MSSEIKVDTISENTSANGVAIDSVTLKDGGVTATAASTITTADNTDTLSLVSTDADANSAPNLVLYRNSGSPADSDQLGYIHFDGRNDNSQDVTYYKILSHIADASDGTEDANVQHQIMTGGSLQNYLSMNSGEVVINDGSIDLDFRVESNGDANCFFVSGSGDKIQTGRDSDSGVTVTGIDLFNFGQMNIFRNASSNVFSIIFNNTNSSNISGSIRQNGDATAFNTSSDYRLKENVDYDWDATTRLKQLKPAKFNWISDDTNTLLEGFLAHEVSSIVPQAVSGEKDKVATADDVAAGIVSSVGDAIHQGIDQSKLVPLIVKTIQELEARIKTLEDA